MKSIGNHIIEKFPVTSETGKEYAVEVTIQNDGFWGFDVATIKIFIRTQHQVRKWFSKELVTKTVDELVSSNIYYLTDTPIIELVKKGIENYELTLVEFNQRLTMLSEYKDWDGKC